MFNITDSNQRWSRWPRGLRRGSAGANTSGVVFVPFACCVMSGGGLCDGPITRPEESDRLWCVRV
jgi:hypothetical protein